MPDPGEQEADDLVDKFYADWELRVWKERLGSRWCVFLTYRDQTYLLLPLSYTAPEQQGV